ncbi:MAG: hypothetical protein QS98_C0003G0015 [archaeon GW2011_AR3]|nr:MAG: hypothetical protein QS98_C0003G0015 [archaeon GW2011_AR3]MBS3110059.1 DUF1761 domain-containing protein [Candidatus Woesearchaeota archaeon]
MGGSVNIYAVLVCAIANIVIGSIWYGPLFGSAWTKDAGLTPKQLKKNKQKGMAKSYIMAFIGALVMAYMLSLFIYYTRASTVLLGMQIAFWAWLGFIATVLMGMVLWEGKPLRLFMINAFHYLIVMLVMGIIITAWP